MPLNSLINLLGDFLVAENTGMQTVCREPGDITQDVHAIDIGHIGHLEKIGRQRLSQNMYMLTLCTWPFDEWLCPYIQSRHLLYIDLPHKVSGIEQLKQEKCTFSEQKYTKKKIFLPHKIKKVTQKKRL